MGWLFLLGRGSPQNNNIKQISSKYCNYCVSIKIPFSLSSSLVGFTVLRCNCSVGLLIRCYQACFCKVVTYKFLFSIAVGQTFSLHWLLFILAEFMCSPSRILKRSTFQIEGDLDLPWELCAVSSQSIQKGGHLGTSACLCLGIRCKYKLKCNLKCKFLGIKICLENTDQLKRL